MTRSFVKAKQALLDKSKTASVIMVSHDMAEIREFCDSAVILHQGSLTFYDDLELALKVYEGL